MIATRFPLMRCTLFHHPARGFIHDEPRCSIRSAQEKPAPFSTSGPNRRRDHPLLQFDNVRLIEFTTAGH